MIHAVSTTASSQPQLAYVSIAWNVVCIQNSRQTVKSTPYGSERHNQYDILCCNRKAPSIILALFLQLLHESVPATPSPPVSSTRLISLRHATWVGLRVADLSITHSACPKHKQYINSIAKNNEHVMKCVPLLRPASLKYEKQTECSSPHSELRSRHPAGSTC